MHRSLWKKSSPPAQKQSTRRRRRRRISQVGKIFRRWSNLSKYGNKDKENVIYKYLDWITGLMSTFLNKFLITTLGILLLRVFQLLLFDVLCAADFVAYFKNENWVKIEAVVLVLLLFNFVWFERNLRKKTWPQKLRESSPRTLGEVDDPHVNLNIFFDWVLEMISSEILWQLYYLKSCS